MTGCGLTDTHCHLNDSRFDEDRADVILRAQLASVERLLVIGYDLASSRFALQIAADNDCVQAVIGVHPDSADEWDSSQIALRQLAASDPRKIVGWGEIGLDFARDCVPGDVQRRVFTEQLDAAAQLGLPVVLHCRDAYDELLDMVAGRSGCRGVLHCFTGTVQQAERAIEVGLAIGVGGIATFKKSSELRATIAGLPMGSILIETDSPYLAPQPWRGGRNEPAYVAAVAQMLADIFAVPAAEIAQRTTENANVLFGPMHQQNFIDR